MFESTSEELFVTNDTYASIGSIVCFEDLVFTLDFPSSTQMADAHEV